MSITIAGVHSGGCFLKGCTMENVVTCDKCRRVLSDGDERCQHCGCMDLVEVNQNGVIVNRSFNEDFDDDFR